ncbi:hypothetical protein O6H91_Y163600 [Diphasiastrum complanatum]|nr:hypothetical protein O6H91_Y163600 [Diphasiastrum complanatum]
MVLKMRWKSVGLLKDLGVQILRRSAWIEGDLLASISRPSVPFSDQRMLLGSASALFIRGMAVSVNENVDLISKSEIVSEAVDPVESEKVSAVTEEAKRDDSYKILEGGRKPPPLKQKSAARQGSVDAKETAKFEIMAETWWDYEGPYKPLHSMNPVRLSFIRSALCKKFQNSNDPRPLEGLNVIDVGCGGGLLCEPLARMGAQVTGIDAVEKNIIVASLHAAKDPLTSSINYSCSTAGKFHRYFYIFYKNGSYCCSRSYHALNTLFYYVIEMVVF